MPKTKQPKKSSIRIGVFMSIALAFFVIIPVFLFSLTQFFWHFFYPLAPTYPEKLWPKYQSPGDLMYELFNLNALISMVFGWILFSISLKPRHSYFWGLLLGFGGYLVAGLLFALYSVISWGAIDPISIVVWPLFVCNCWLY